MPQATNSAGSTSFARLLATTSLNIAIAVFLYFRFFQQASSQHLDALIIGLIFSVAMTGVVSLHALSRILDFSWQRIAALSLTAKVNLAMGLTTCCLLSGGFFLVVLKMWSTSTNPAQVLAVLLLLVWSAAMLAPYAFARLVSDKTEEFKKNGMPGHKLERSEND